MGTAASDTRATTQSSFCCFDLGLTERKQRNVSTEICRQVFIRSALVLCVYGPMVLLVVQFPSVDQEQSSKDLQTQSFRNLTSGGGTFTCLLAHD